MRLQSDPNLTRPPCRCPNGAQTTATRHHPTHRGPFWDKNNLPYPPQCYIKGSQIDNINTINSCVRVPVYVDEYSTFEEDNASHFPENVDVVKEESRAAGRPDPQS